MRIIIQNTLGENLQITPNKDNEGKYDLSTFIGPVRHYLLVGLEQGKIMNYLTQYGGLRDVSCPKVIRKEFRQFIDWKYPFDITKATFATEDDLEDIGQIRKDINQYISDMRCFFGSPKLETKYYPYGVEVSVNLQENVDTGQYFGNVENQEQGDNENVSTPEYACQT